MSKKVYEKLFKIQKEVKALEGNAEGHGYSYLNQSKLLGIIRPLMDELGLMLLTEIEDVKNYRVDYVNARGENKYEFRVEMNLKYIWVDVESGETLELKFFQEAQNGQDKSTGSALTYSKRMFLINQFNIANDKDDLDAKAKEIFDNQPAPKEVIKDFLFSLTKIKQLSREEIFALIGLKPEDKDTLTQAQIDLLKIKVKTKIKEMKKN